MKRTSILLLSLFCSTVASAQFKLSGKVINYSGQEPLKINIPLVYGFYEQNSVSILVDKSGKFAISLPVGKQRFADLVFQRAFHLLLMADGKDLSVEFNEATKQFKLTGGTALTENKVLESVNIEEYPFFLKNDDLYGRLDLAGLNTKLIKPYFADRDRKIALVNSSSIAAADKKLIAAEVRYAAYNGLYEMEDLGTENRDAILKMITAVYDKAGPKPDVMPAGPQYYTFARNYVDNMQAKALAAARHQNLKPDQPMPYFGFSVDSANALQSKHSRPYRRWVASTKFLPDAVTEAFNYQQIVRSFNDKDAAEVATLGKLFLKKFPASAYAADVKQKVAGLKQR